MADDTKKLRAGLATTKAHSDAVLDARRQLVRKAEDQLDTVSGAISEWEKAVQAGRGGGPLAARRLRMLHDERNRLEAVLAKHGHVLHGA